MTESTEPLRLIYMQIRNFMGIIVADFEPADGPITLIAGGNGEGKTAALEAVAVLLNAKPPADPIHHGASQAEVRGGFSNGLQIERIMRKHAGPQLKLSYKGQPGTVKRPVSALEALHANSFDPLEFDRMKKDARGAKLRGLLKLDWSGIVADEKRITQERRDIGREGDRLAAQLDKMPEGAPGKPLESQKLRAELKRKEQANWDIEDRQEAAERAQRKAREAEEGALGRIGELEAELEEIRQNLADCGADLAKARIAHEDSKKLVDQRTKELEAAQAAEPESLNSVREQLSTIEETNAKVAAREDYQAQEAAVAEKRSLYQTMTEQLQALAAKKREQLADADMPVPGLGFDDQGNVTLLSRDGHPVPWEQANMADRIRASVAIGAASNPRMRLMIVRDGSVLTKKSLEALAVCLEERGAHAIIEDARAGEEAHVVMEAGMVKR